MKAYPHQYLVRAKATADNNVTLESTNPEGIVPAPPIEFVGPRDRWSPEALLVASIVDCFTLSFCAVAKASRLSWIALSCEAAGVLDKDNEDDKGTTQFTSFFIKANLTVSGISDKEVALRFLEKAESICLVTKSLKVKPLLKCNVGIAI